MRFSKSAALLLASTSLLASASAQDTSAAEAAHRLSTEWLEANPNIRFDPSTMLVRFKANQSEVERENLRQTVGAGGLRKFQLVDGLELINVRIDMDLAIGLLRPHVEYAEPNWVQRTNQTPNDTYIGLQWGVNNTGQAINGTTGINDADIDGYEAWDILNSAAGVAVAIIDTGTDWDHEDLAGNIWSNPGEIAGNGIDDDGNGYVDDVRGWDFYSNDSNPDDAEGHGSHTAGTVGAVGNNGVGVAGVAWQCELVPLRFLGPQGGYTSDAILAVQYCTSTGIRISNNSWGGGGFSQGLYDAINASKSIGHVFVAAAGNDGTNNDVLPHYPSNYNLDNIISVAATDNTDVLVDEGTWGSNYGATTVDIGAPGLNIASTWVNNGYVWNSGTSMATPHVTGVAVLLLAQNPGWTYSQIINRLYSTARPLSSLSGKCTTGAMLNAYDALNGGGGPDVTPPSNPAGLGATAGDGSVSLNWNNNGEGDLAGYRVYRSTSSGGGYSDISGLIGSSAYNDNAVANGTTYYYVVTAEDTSGNESGNSSEVSATPQSSADVTPPANPSGLGATAGNGTVSLDWNDNGEGDLAGYHVYRSTSSGGGYSDISGLIGASAYADNAVTNGTTYYYVVSAEDTSGNESGDSGEVSATPQGSSGGVTETIFFGGFESGTFGAEGWVTSGSTLVSNKADQGGTYGARIKGTSWIEKSVSTAGYDTVELTYARRTGGLDSGEVLTVEYWNGSSWVTVESTNSTAWSVPTWSLGASADNNSAFKIRFRTNANRNNERADVDDVALVGTTL
ncbi:MAG: subtilisin family serine protease [Candidatus Paceibacteria bacterium]|jgi:subtilisin family serine protease